MDPLKLRQELQTDIINCLNRFYAIETGMWGGPIDALIIRTIFVGYIQNKPFDLSALTNFLDLPIATIHRKVRKIEEMGFIQSIRKGRSLFLYPTDKTELDLDKSFDEMISTLTRLYKTNIK